MDNPIPSRSLHVHCETLDRVKAPVSVTAFLAMLRALHPDLEWRCLRWSCFHLYLLLKDVWPNAEPWCNIDHVITEIDGLFYGIRGEVLSDGYSRMKDDALLFNRAYHWGTDIQDRMNREAHQETKEVEGRVKYNPLFQKED